MGLHLIQNIIIFFNFALIIFIFIKIFRYKTCEQSLVILNKNIDLLGKIFIKQHSNDLKKMIELYSEVQTILKISEASFINLFRYVYSKKYILLHFMFSINKNGEIVHESYLDKLPITSNMLNLEILKSGDCLCDIKVDHIKELDIKAYQFIKNRNIEKIYFKNIIKDVDFPAGYISLSYQNDYILDDVQREEINRIITKISELL